MKYVFIALWLAILAYLISLMAEICKPQPEQSTSASGTTGATETTEATATEAATDAAGGEGFTNSDYTFDYTENFEPNDSTPDIGDNAAPRDQVANQDISFEPPVDNSEVLENNVTQDDDEELLVEGTDALIAASSDRFYSVDTKGQTNRNASNDLRGDLPIAYNSNYTPFNQSAIYGEPLVPAGRL
tara:strand:- start:1012 stop:1572 length:561 start_codon:yes stop_codon:yes gene_type:complete